MRRLWLAAPLMIAIAAPAAAQNADNGVPPPANEDLWDDDPYAEQDDNALAVDALVEALLSMPVGAFIAAFPQAEIEGDIRGGDTLADVLTRGDPAAEEDLRSKARLATAALAQMLSRAEGIGPALEEWSERMTRELDGQ